MVDGSRRELERGMTSPPSARGCHQADPEPIKREWPYVEGRGSGRLESGRHGNTHVNDVHLPDLLDPDLDFVVRPRLRKNGRSGQAQ